MEANPDYWFAKYDSESFEKDFQKVLFMEYLNQLVRFSTNLCCAS